MNRGFVTLTVVVCAYLSQPVLAEAAPPTADGSPERERPEAQDLSSPQSAPPSPATQSPAPAPQQEAPQNVQAQPPVTQAPASTGQTQAATTEAASPSTPPAAQAPQTQQPAPSQPQPTYVPPAAPSTAPSNPDLLAPSIGETPSTSTAPVSPTRRDSSDLVESRDEELRAYYRKLYRPDSNPSRLYFRSSLLFSTVGRTTTNGNNGGGRFGVFEAEAGQSWNWIGYGVGLSVLGGQYDYDQANSERINALFGGGVSLSMGRLALHQKSYLDIRPGYNVYFGSPTGDDTSSPDPVLTHGPKLRIHTGFLLDLDRRTKVRHGLEVTIGYQALLANIQGQLPLTHMIMFGLGYTFG